MNRKDRMDRIKTEKENERRGLIGYLDKIERDNGDIDFEWFQRNAKSDREDTARGLYRLIEDQGKQQISLLEKILDKLEDK